ncbi:MAG: SDR family oxidoreductase [Methylococcales bacterium]|jgi:NAD(P)-dependent dehydrogenase (short-subunit alcohol dehydrogenase family)|nr:SDR family oxidoreductase [Methylococcales bacterium]
MSTILITGANRGIGLALAEHYAKHDWTVIAACRDTSQATALNQLKTVFSNVMIYTLDVTLPESIRTLAGELKGHPVDILFNNAGVYGNNVPFGSNNTQDWFDVFSANTFSAMEMMQAFVDHVAMSGLKVMANMTSKMGSMADNGSGGCYPYRASKAALNAIVKSASIDLQPQGITVLALHPGWVLTDMGGPNAEINTKQCIDKLSAIIDQSTLADSGRFVDIDGSDIAW